VQWLDLRPNTIGRIICFWSFWFWSIWSLSFWSHLVWAPILTICLTISRHCTCSQHQKLQSHEKTSNKPCSTDWRVLNFCVWSIK